LVVLLLGSGGGSTQQLVVGPNVNISSLAGAQSLASLLGTAADGFVPVNAWGGDRGGDGGSSLACGPNLVCNPTTHYCSAFFGGPVGVPPNYVCADLPDDCPSPPTCECIRGIGIGCECTESSDGITVTCTAP
jgi:hypothetical protein